MDANVRSDPPITMVELWKTRNEERHGKDQEARTAKLQAEVESRLKELYQEYHNIMPVDRAIYPFRTAQEHLHSHGTLDTKLDWCLDTHSAIMASKQQAQERGIQANLDIQRYMLNGHNRPLPRITIQSTADHLIVDT